MSSKAKPYIIGAALGASTMFFALQYHVVHSHDGFQVVPRTPQQSIGLAYADIRNWSPSQWTDRPELARALMAHGSSDLIADSVASTLADAVSEDSHRLDELRSFLNDTRTKVEEGADELLSIPRDFDSGESGNDPQASRNRASDVVGIPFPKDADKPAADPFRPPVSDDNSSEPGTMAASERKTDVASRTAAPLKNNSGANRGSRISADEILEGFEEVEDTKPAGVSAKNSNSGKTSGSSSLLEQARKAEDLIFGKEPAGSAGSSNKASIRKSNPKTSAPPSSSESVFEDVTSQLENRAQEALNRAQENAKTRVSTAVEDASKSGAGFVRSNIEQALPDAAKSILNNSSAPIAPGDSSSLFDPFLE